MSDDESGQYAKLRAPKDWRLPIGWSLLLAALAASVSYGVGSGQSSQRLSDLEKRSQEQAARMDAQSTQLAAHDVKIAVISEKLDTIILQLGHVNEKLERAELERK